MDFSWGWVSSSIAGMPAMLLGEPGRRYLRTQHIGREQPVRLRAVTLPKPLFVDANPLQHVTARKLACVADDDGLRHLVGDIDYADQAFERSVACE